MTERRHWYGGGMRPSVAQRYTVLRATPSRSGPNVLYIGRTKNISQRWLGHHRKADVAQWDNVSISWLEFDGSIDLLDEIERACIEHFRPILNGRAVESAARVRVLAEQENRSISSMLATLVDESLHARQEHSNAQP